MQSAGPAGPWAGSSRIRSVGRIPAIRSALIHRCRDAPGVLRAGGKLDV